MNLLVLGVLFLILVSEFVNGWTDAPNSIAIVVSTKVLSLKKAILLAVVFNFLGVLFMGTAVANTIGNMVNLLPGNLSLLVLGSAQIGIIIFGAMAWKFGIPTSESHALIAGLTGASMAISPLGGFFGLESVNWGSWIKVIQGLLISSIFGFGASFMISKTISYFFKDIKDSISDSIFSKAQIISACGMAFSHGAQDGQKFMGVFAKVLVLAGLLSLNTNGTLHVPIGVMVVCSLIMALGTSVGGYRIIRKMGMEMVPLDKKQGFSAELSSSLCLLFASILGIPVSTTHTKVTSIIGVGVQKDIHKVNWAIVRSMFFAWIFTFPVCAFIGFVLVKISLFFN